MKIRLHKNFKKSFDKRVKTDQKLRQKFNERLDLFRSERMNPLLRDHALKGDMLGYRSFSVTGDVRVIYIETDELIVLVDIGTHNQVY
jgi:addiction module RelE/StbE family toxin